MHLSSKSLWGGMAAMIALGTLGCGSDTTGPSTSGPLYWQLQLNHHAVTLATVAPYNTIRLIATPLDAAGAPIATTTRPVFTTSDTSITIDSTGLVRVHRTGSNKLNITVIAALTVGGATGSTLADTAVVNVVNWSDSASVPVLDSLLFRPVAGDSARRAVLSMAGGAITQSFDTPVAKNLLGETIKNVVVRYRSSDPLIASFATATAGTVTPVAPGVVLLTAEATVYGRSVTDSMWYTVGYPLGVNCFYGTGQLGQLSSLPLPSNHLSLGNLVVGQGGAVVWSNSTQGLPDDSDDSLDIQFDDTVGIAGLATQSTVWRILFPPGPGGNIPAFPASVPLTLGVGGIITEILDNSTNSRVRIFTTPGMYHWHSQHRGIAGSVLVVSNDSLHQR